jgi:acetyl-CoA carboxylase carboxyl transferase subunit alpha
LWKDADRKADAAAALKMTASELKQLGIVDGIVPEPLGGAHRDPPHAAQMLKQAICDTLDELKETPLAELLEERYRKLRRVGRYRESGKPVN